MFNLETGLYSHFCTALYQKNKTCLALASETCELTAEAIERGYPKTADVNYVCYPHRCPRRENIMQLYNGLLEENQSVISNRTRIPTVKLKIPGTAFLKSESRTSVTFKL